MSSPRLRARRPLTALSVVAIGITGNSYTIGRDLITGALTRFDWQMRTRDATLRACASRPDATCSVPPIQEPPKTFFLLDVSADPQHWINAAYAQYDLTRVVRQ